MMFSLWNPAGFWTGPASAPTCLTVAAKKFITGCHSRHENSSEFAQKKKKTPVKNIESPSGLRAKLHVHLVFLRDSMHAHSQTQTPNGVTESRQTNSSKIICVFFNFCYHVLEVYLRLQRHFTNLTNQGQQYKRFQGHQSTLFQFIQRMNSNMQSINHFNLRLVSEYEQLWFAIDLYW